jgi:nucleoside-diphosphate-sugar epimerase
VGRADDEARGDAERAMRVALIGCGYAGRVLLRCLISRGDPVRATTTTEGRLSQLAALGAEPRVVRSDKPETLGRTLEGAEAIVYLAPPAADQSPEALAQALAGACPSSLKVLLYGSTTGVYGPDADADAWVDERTQPDPAHERGAQRLAIERALYATGLPLRVLRIAGIYGPGRTLADSMRRQELLLFDGGPPTSRVHVEDLARLMVAMLGPSAPPLALACDEAPVPTLEVARYTAELLGLEVPAPIPIEDAKRLMSKRAMEMRLGGHRCRSLVRERLIGALEYPSYREGVPASLRAEGLLRGT